MSSVLTGTRLPILGCARSTGSWTCRKCVSIGGNSTARSPTQLSRRKLFATTDARGSGLHDHSVGLSDRTFTIVIVMP